MRLQIKDIIKETDDALTLCFKNGNLFKLSYKPGQFLTIHASIDNKIHKSLFLQ